MVDYAQVASQCLDALLMAIEEQEEDLARLDSVAGDGDHGAGMVRGWRAAAAAPREGFAGQVIARAGAAFSDAAGGASGALVGMLVVTIGNSLPEDPGDAHAVHTALKNGLATIGKLGKAQPGDKTMIDTLTPFVAAFGEAAQNGLSVRAAWAHALPAAEAGMKSTRDMVSKRGRSSVLKEKSIGHLDPGAVSMYHMLQAVGGVLDAHCPA